MNMFPIDYEFVLPRGYVDAEGNLHREGVMRLATAADEILPLKDPRVLANPAYQIIILFSRVITRLGSLSAVTPKVIEGVFTADIGYLQAFYNRINDVDRPPTATCPHCQREVPLGMEGRPPGE